MNKDAVGVVSRSLANDEIYRYARAEMQTELALINAPVNWLITSQAFLFVPLVLGATGASVSQSVFFPFVPHLGIALCFLVLVSVVAAVWRRQSVTSRCCASSGW